MKVQSLGHVVIKVRDQQKAEDFYNGVLGLPIVARLDTYNMTFFSFGDDHHDFAIAALGADAPPAQEDAAGLAHVAFKVGDSLDELRDAKAHLDKAGIEARTVDHVVSQSLYFSDPDGNTVELYVDGSDIWKEDPQQVAQTAPLAL